MNDWTAGYVADVGYTFGYYSELNPLRLKLAFLNAGLVAPEVNNACELGFGQGLSINIHAAASAIQWHGTDFNPSQASFARELTTISGSGTQLFDQSFEEFAQRTDLPEFDYIGVHGIWSWISEHNRTVIVDMLRRKLKVGGVLYISYNTLPGWAAFAPMRHLMTEHTKIIGAEGHGIVNCINGALEFSQKFLEMNPIYARANPQINERFKRIKEQNRNYLAHEYFNRDWLPMHVSTLGEYLAPAKLNYACSAHYLDHIDGINLTNEQQKFLQEIPDAMFRETVRDFMVNQQFRRDYWVKGARRLTTIAQAEALRRQKVLLVSPRSDVSLKINGALGEANMNAEIYAPFLDLIADHKPQTLGALEQGLKFKLNLGQIVQSALVLMGAGHLAVVQEDSTITRAKKYTDRLNSHFLDKARGSPDINYLASPVTGGGITVGRFQQLFLLARSQSKKQPAEWATFAWQILASQGQRLIKEGKTLETAEENLAELTNQAQAFADKQAPVLKALQII